MSEAVHGTKVFSGGDSTIQQAHNQQDVAHKGWESERGGIFPLSFGQQRLWLLDQLTPNMPTYNVPMCMRLTGLLNATALSQCLNQVIQRHHILRATFPAIDGLPTQIVAPTLEIPMPVTDLQGEPDDQREGRLQVLIHQEINTPFHLEEGPLLRAQLFRLSTQEHILLFNIHHIIFDGWSEVILFQELTALYNATCKGTTPSLPPVLRQYTDYISWQHAWLEGEQLQDLLMYWRQQLDGIPPKLHLPTDHLRPSMQSFRGARTPFQCPREVSVALQRLRKQEGVTLFMALLAAWQTLLYRYTRQEDICVGTSAAGRTEEEFQDVIGFFVNTLVLRGRLSDSLSFRELLRQVRETSLDAYEHQNLPFERLVEELETGRDPSYNPLFQVFFALHNVMAASPPTFFGLEVLFIPLVHDTVKFDLSIGMWETSEGLGGYIDYSMDLFEASTIARMIGHFQTLLAALVATPDQTLGTLSLLTEAEQQILVEWNSTESQYPRDTCIHQIFEEQAVRMPNKVAVVCENQSLTYAELEQQANQLAGVLRGLGVGPEVRVGICIERSLAMVIGLLAILKAGGAYVPLDPADPKERIAFLLEDIGIKTLLTRKQFSAVLPPSQVQLVYLDAEQPPFVTSDTAPAGQSTAESLAYVISTSGSTGKPKGVCVTHRNVVRLLKSSNVVTISPQDVLLQFTPLTFDVSMFEIWGSLLNGARLAVFPPQHPSLEELGQFIQQNEITTMWLTSGLFHQMIESQAQKLQGVRQLLAGGDVLSVTYVRKALQDLPKCRLINGYGPTENTIFTCYAHVTEQTDLSRSVPIGHPVAQTQAYLLDPLLQPVPIGVPAELYAGGDGVTRGYLNRPELTSERFIKNPFSANPEARLYKTGDLARFLEDGTIEFLGRNDNQVKIRGFRVEPGEVEAVLRQHPAVQQVLVLVLDDPQGDKRLVAYVALQPTSEASRKHLRQYLEVRLPNYMIPSAFLIIDAFPLTPSGKIDRSALPIPDAESGARFVAPRNAVEAQIARLFSDLLGIHPVSVMDNFFELGGHSLSAMRLIGRLQKQFGQDIPLSTFFGGPTVEKLAHFLYQKSERLPATSLVGIQPTGTKPPLILVHPASGNVFPYVTLGSYMKSDQPVYAFEESCLSSQWKPCARVEEIAARYLDMMRTFQPQGPYYLGGWSFGGLIAFEMARRLRQKGQKVALLAMIDTYAPLPEYLPQTEDDTCIISWAAKLFAFCWPDHPQGYLPSFLPLSTLRQMSVEQQWQYITEIAIKVNFADSTEQVKRWIEIYKQHVQANQTYKPGDCYPDRITLLKMVSGQQMTQPFTDSTLGWSHFTSEPIEVCLIEGDHFGIAGAAGPILAERLEYYIDQAIREQRLPNPD
ncbi:MAG: amino acid adenylation domain-containing protein [Ktedonobacteraceae bacterium]|nr:amino acid adenylation domain-containing protein [Ktedonobacteraceae bacterium]